MNEEPGDPEKMVTHLLSTAFDRLATEREAEELRSELAAAETEVKNLRATVSAGMLKAFERIESQRVAIDLLVEALRSLHDPKHHQNRHYDPGTGRSDRLPAQCSICRLIARPVPSTEPKD